MKYRDRLAPEQEKIVNVKEYLSLFFLLCTTEEGGTSCPRIAQMPGENWPEFTHFCITRSVAPYLYSRILENHLTGCIPADSLHRLKQLYLTNMGLNTAAKDQFLEILSAMKQFDIPVIPLKGAHLGFRLYKDPALRMMSDLDILVRKEDIPRTMQALESLGYAVNPKFWESPGHHLPPLKKPQAFFPVEVHWRIIPPARMASLPIDTIWDNARQTALEDCEYLELNPVHLLVHLCQHAAYQHYFSNGIKAICDIDVIVQFYANVLNWQEFLSIIDAINAAKGVLLALWISRQHLKTPLPPIIEEAISAQSFPERIIEDALLSMSGAKEFPDRPSEGIANTIRWWLGKARKFLGETQAVPSNTGRSSFFASTQNSASRLAYVIQNNMAALIKMQKNTPLDDSAQSQKRIRNYLGLN